MLTRFFLLLLILHSAYDCSSGQHILDSCGNGRDRQHTFDTHVFKENIPQLSSRTDLLRRSRVDNDYIHEITFVIKQKNMDILTDILHRVSNPLSDEYGQHLTREEINALTFNSEALHAVNFHLQSIGAFAISESLGGEYITAKAKIGLWEKIFQTEFFIFHQTHQNKFVEKLIRAEKYCIPRVLNSHIEGAFNVIDMPIKAFGSVPKPSRLLEVDTLTGDPSTYTQPGYITPYKLKSYYNMSNSARGNKFSTQGIFATNDQYYSPNDITAFQRMFGLPIQSVIKAVGDHGSDQKCIENVYNCVESNLDLEYIMAMSPLSPTSHLYTDDTFSDYLIYLANLSDPPKLLSISYAGYEISFTQLMLSTFNNEAIKLGSMGVTILAASGDSGATSLSTCEYAPLFPATNPYVTTVGATSVRYYFNDLVHYECIYFFSNIIVFYHVIFQVINVHFLFYISVQFRVLSLGILKWFVKRMRDL